MQTNYRNCWHAAGLAFLAGWVDTLGFVALFGLFTAHVTGNFVLIGAALAGGPQQSITLKLLAFPAFVLGVAVTRMLVTSAQARNWPALQMAVSLQLALLALFMACGMLAGAATDSDAPMVIAAGSAGAAAMGVHAATARLLFADLAPTSMMTGNVTQVVIDTVDWIGGRASPGAGSRCLKFLLPVLAFGAAAIGAAFAYHAVGFLALLVPLAILLAVLAGASSARSAS